MFNARSSIVNWLWNHNPFYVISALLMLYGVHKSYGVTELDIGNINSWVMTGVLITYTAILAIVGVLIVRWGKVWDDARSIFLVLLLLFLAVSVSADDILVKLESAWDGALLVAGGFGFAMCVLFGVLKGSRIRLRFCYLGPLISFLALFFVAPWWCSRELRPFTLISLNWTLFLFPQIAAVLAMFLIPAVRLGQRSVAGNGTPWPWPVFPWSAFVIVGIAVALRSFALTMTFSQSGPIWNSPDDRSGIILDTVWRPYFLVPFCLAVLILITESGLACGNRRLVRQGLLMAPSLLVLAWPSWNSSETMEEFLGVFCATLGSPLWLTVWLLVAFYLGALVQKIRYAEVGLLASALILAIVGPQTVSLQTLTSVNPIPLSVVGILAAAIAMRRRMSTVLLSASLLLIAACWIWIPQMSIPLPRTAICYHLVLLSLIMISMLCRDWFARQLQSVAAMMFFISTLLALYEPTQFAIAWEWRLSYALVMIGIAYLCARISRSPTYWTGFVSTVAGTLYSIAAEGYRNARAALGPHAIVAFSWSVGTLITGVLISAYKAEWLPPLAWLQGHHPHIEKPPETDNPNLSLGSSDIRQID